jgi:hypothetical protein
MTLDIYAHAVPALQHDAAPRGLAATWRNFVGSLRAP